MTTKTTTIENGGSCDNSHKNHLGWVHTHHMGVHQKKNFYFWSKRNMVISPPKRTQKKYLSACYRILIG